MRVKIKLKYALNDGGQEVSELNLRRPKVRDMLTGEKQGGSDAEKEVLIFANLCDIPPALIEEMDIVDYQQLQQAYQDFLS